MKAKQIYLRRKTPLIMVSENHFAGRFAIESREGSSGRWSLSGDENGPWLFESREERDDKIKELEDLGGKLVEK